MQQNLVLVLDEAIEYHNFIVKSLKQVYGEEIEVQIEEPLKTKEQMIKHIQEVSERLAALIIDERLTETGICDYLGSELAEAYRSFDPKIPIYILTSFPGSVDEKSGDIEYVIDKDDLTDDLLVKKLSPKLRRHVDIYRDMVDVRKKRIDELLIKQLDATLTTGEIQELKDLQFWRARPIELEESILSEELRTSLDKKEKILSELEDRLNRKS